MTLILLKTERKSRLLFSEIDNACAGIDYCMKSGIGSYAVQIGELKIEAIVVVNALGNVYDWKTGKQIAGMAHDGYARSINPVHTSADGDSIYAVSIGDVAADQELVGALSAEIVSEAIFCAVENAEGAYGFPALRDLCRE